MTAKESTLRNFVTVRGALFIFALSLTLFFPLAIQAQPPVVVDFEGLAAGPVLNQYAAQGVTFTGSTMANNFLGAGIPHSGTGAVELCFAQEFCSAPLTINFTSGQARVKLWIGYNGAISPAQSVKMQALDSGGAVLNQVTTLLGPSTAPIPINIPLEINTPTANIRKVILRFDAGPGVTTFNNGLLIDDVEFSTSGPPPACGTTVAPSVGIFLPPLILPNGPTVQINEFLLQGAVNTSVPLDEASMVVMRPDGTTSTSNLLNTMISMNGGNFGVTRMNGSLLPGVNTVAVRVKNCAGTATSQRKVTYAPIPADAKVKFLGMEVTQATQDLQNSVPIVANKPTVVRVYLSVSGSVTSLDGMSGGLVATKPGGTYLVPLLRSINDISINTSTDVSTKRLSMTQSLNFVLPASWTFPSTVHFKLSKLYIQGHEIKLPRLDADGHIALSPCEGCDNLDSIGAPRWTQFRPTKPLNLVLAPYVYERSATGTPDTFLTPMGALQWLNNVYPVSGNFPSSSSSPGIRLMRFLPMRTTGRNLFNSGDGGDFLDELEDILDSMREDDDLPSDTRLVAMTPFGGGGRARRPGKVSYVDTWAVENGPVPQVSFEGYGQIWSHELGHNFNRKHLSNSHGEIPPLDLGSPFPHGGIGHPGMAIITNYWLATAPSVVNPGTQAAGSPHAHDLMSYGSVNSPGGEHTRNWISPYTYKALFDSFEELAAARIARPPREAKLVVAGKIDGNGEVTLRPFRTVSTRYASGTGTTGEYTIELVDARGTTLLSYRFDPQEVEDSPTKSFSEFVPWKAGTKVIQITRGKRVVARRVVSPNKPWIRVITPKARDSWSGKATVTWTAGDNDKDELTYTLLYNTGNDQTWIPIATGVKETSTTVDTSILPGSDRARVRVRVTDGVNTSESESAIFTVGEKQPRVVILSPTASQFLAPSVEPRLVGVAYDPEDGMLPESSLVWTSDRDGILSISDCKPAKPLSSGQHVITLTATDSDGNTVTASVKVQVGLDRLRVR